MFNKKDTLKIKLLSPENNSVANILPNRQSTVMSALPKNESQIKNSFDWINPVMAESDSSLPKYVVFTWGYEGDLSEVLEVFLYFCENKEFENCTVYNINAMQSFLSVTNLSRDKKYYWKMAAFGEKGIISESEIYTFSTSPELPQWYYIAETTNVRDIGGRKTADGRKIKSGMIIRGAETDTRFRLTNGAIDFLKNKLKIATELDMRKPEDAESSRQIYSEKIINIPIKAYGNLLTEEPEKQKLAEVFRIFADRNSYPIYMHCIAGADRTGTVAALLEALLGLDYEEIADDYELTSLSIFGIRSRYHEFFQEIFKVLSEYSDNLKSAAEIFLKTCGITQNEIEEIRNILLT